MESNKFEVGDVVRLKSGSPPLTIEKITVDGIYVAWLNHWNNIKRDAFPAACLVKAIFPGDIFSNVSITTQQEESA